MSSVVTIPTPLATCGAWVETAITKAIELQKAGAPSCITDLSSEALKVWKKLLFPTAKLEAWKYTNPETIAQGPFAFGEHRTFSQVEIETALQVARIPGLAEGVELVFVDGVFVDKLSRICQQKGILISRVAAGSPQSDRVGALGLHREEAFAALATTLFSDAVTISVERGASSTAPIHVIYLSTSALEGGVVTPRVLLEAAENSEVCVIESHLGMNGTRYLSLPVLEIRAANGAIVDYYRVQQESCAAYHVSGSVVEQAASATVRTHIFSFGGGLVRNHVNVLLQGSGSHSVLNGLSLLSDSQHVDNTTLIHHQQPSIESREHFKGIYAGSSRGVFSGTITVDKIAQKTNAFQSNQALLLSTDASIESRPQLKIWADDVKCTHGATVGQLDSNAMFYLQSRGVSREEARAFLVHAFASEVLTSVQVGAVKEYVEGVLSKKLDVISGHL